ncbi:MAG: DUF4240 domain-containing protein [Saprospiraceae bacterium]|nr:DUF4240 domain-containing protein [Saprospiraceae bacterium]
MSTILKINVQELDTQFLENLKQEFANSELEIWVHDQAEPVPAFSDEAFWALIALLDWSDESDDARVIEPAIQALARQPLAVIYRFYDLLSEKLWHLDTREHAQVFLDDPEEEGYLSVDDFLYARCAVVANGRQFYEEVLSNPSAMPKDATFESLLYIAMRAYKQQTGNEFTAQPSHNFETYSNKEGWAKK